VNDFSRLSDDQLQALYAQRQQGQPSSPPADLSTMSDEDLMRLYQQRAGVPQGQAATRGLAQGVTANLADEMAGLAAASPIPGSQGTAGMPNFNAVDVIAGGARMLGEKAGLWGSGEAGKAYDERVAAERGADKQAKKDNPWTYGGTEVLGGVALPTFGAGAAGVKGLIGLGAGYGAASGFGSGEGAADSAVGAGIGAGLGAGVGAALPVVGRAIWAAADATGIPTMVRAARNPAAQAEREVAAAFGRDMRATAPRMDPDDFRAALAEGQPAVVADMGGNSVRRLARSAANLSDEAEGVLKGVTEERYRGMAPRFQDFFENLYGGPGALDNTVLTDAVQTAAKYTNSATYKAAAKAAEKHTLWDDELARLAQSPSFQKAMRDVDVRAADRMVRDGDTPIRNPFRIDEDGNFLWRTTDDGGVVLPNLTYWDQVKRNLDSQIGAAKMAGDKPRVADLTGLKSQLTLHLDGMIPEYALARAGAAGFFGAENMVEAGEKFFRQSTQRNLTDVQKLLRGVDPEQRDFFERGFVAELMRGTQRPGNSSSAFNNPTMREKIGMVVGEDRAKAIEAFARREQIMNFLKDRVGGGSTTAMQQIAAGAVGGVGAGVLTSGDPVSAGAAALAAGLARRGQLQMRESTAKEIASILTSTDPTKIAEIIRKSEAPGKILSGLRLLDRTVTTAARSAGAAGAPVRTTADDERQPQGFADGGRVIDEIEDMIRRKVMGEEPRPFAGGGRVDPRPNRPDSSVEDATFIGRQATRFLPKLFGRNADRAEEMLGKGASRPETWAETGWSTDKSGMLVGELSDRDARLLTPGLERLRGGQDVSLGEILNHPQMFDAYPSSFRTKVQSLNPAREPAGQRGWYDHYADEIGTIRTQTPEQMLDNLLHEHQHRVQDIEGFAHGAAPSMFPKPDVWKQDEAIKDLRETLATFEYLQPRGALTYADARSDLRAGKWASPYDGRPDPLMVRQLRDGKLRPEDVMRDIERLEAEKAEILRTTPSQFEQYLNTLGEVNARLPGQRLRMTEAERRANFPWPDESRIGVLKPEPGRQRPNNPDPMWETFRRAMQAAGAQGTPRAARCAGSSTGPPAANHRR
jgi:hypothetical protein